MKFGYCGINYKSAGLDIRDKVVFTDSVKNAFSKQLEDIGIEQCMILATCNRSEVYYFFEREEQSEKLSECFKNMFPQAELEECLNQQTGGDALRYFFRVTAGMESQVLGEDQILGQVKDAFEFSRTMGYSRKELNRVVMDAMKCAKKIKTELKISQHPLSVSYVGVQQLENMCGISGRNVLIIGSGQTAALALRYVYAYGAAHITVCNRTSAHAKSLKAEFPDVIIGDFEDRYKIMRDCDIVISATSSPHLVIEEDRCMTGREVYLLDLAAPRDIEVKLATHPGYHLINLDMLEKVTKENLMHREELTEKGEVYVTDAVEEVLHWLQSAGVDETIQSVQVKCDEIVEDSFAYLKRKLELTEREQRIVKRTLKASFHRLLKEPVLELKKLESEEEQSRYTDTLAKLFQLGQE